MATTTKDTPALDVNLDGPEGSRARQLWWTLPDEEAGPEAVATFEDIEASLVDRRMQMLRQARVFTNSYLGTLYDMASARMDRQAGPWNVCSAAVSTALSMVVRSPVKITLETSGAEHSAQRLARDAVRWFYGVLSDNKIAEKVAPLVFQDAAVCDIGVAVVRVIDKKIKIERVFPDEVIISETEAMYGNPYQGAIKTYRPKHAIMSKYGRPKDGTKAEKTAAEVRLAAIKRIAIEAPGNGSATGYQSNLIPVWECWSKNGKHLVAVKGCTLEIEDWDYDFLPMVPLVIEPAAAGWYGRGYVQQLLGYQIELFFINDAIDAQIRLMTASKWVLDASSGIDPADLDNLDGGVLTKNRGSDNPHVLIGQISSDLLKERESIYNRALEEIGLSSWSISGQEPAGRSGIAMSTARDKERGRLLTPGQAYEAWHVALAEICFAMGRQTNGTKYAGKGPADKALEAIDFAKISKFLSDAPWMIRPYPISALPDSPDERRKAIESWLESGLITAPVAQSLMQLPDIDAEASLISASREFILHIIEKILDEGRDGYMSPEINMDLGLASKMMLAAWNKARMQGVDEERTDLLSKWMAEAQALAKPPTPPVQVERREGVGLAPAVVAPIDPNAGPPPGAPPGLPPGMAPPPGPEDLPAGMVPPAGPAGAPVEMPPGVGPPA